jgi:hypothetical protein
MKLYIQDCSWAGSIVVIANSEAEDRELMSDEHNYDPKGEVMEEEIRVGFIFTNLGDM